MSAIKSDARVILVTGAGGDLGGSAARHLATRGANVVLADIDADALDREAESIRTEGCCVDAVVGSGVTESEAAALVSHVEQLHGRLDAIVNAARVLTSGALGEVDVGSVLATMEANLLGTIWVTRASLPLLHASGSGRIVNLASTCGVFGVEHAPIYAAASAGVIGLTKALAADLSAGTIKVNVIAPLCQELVRGYLHSDHLDLYAARHIAPTVSYLAHPNCSLNGEVLSVGGGRIASVFGSVSIGAFVAGSEVDEIGDSLERILDPKFALRLRHAREELVLVDV